jgi:hypothetical protein
MPLQAHACTCVLIRLKKIQELQLREKQADVIPQDEVGSEENKDLAQQIAADAQLPEVHHIDKKADDIVSTSVPFQDTGPKLKTAIPSEDSQQASQPDQEGKMQNALGYS